MGCGRQKGYTEQYRGSRANISLLPKIKVETVVPAEHRRPVVEAIVAAAYTGEIGDGRVFVYPVEQAVRIRTGERGEETVVPRGGGGLGPLGRALHPLEPVVPPRAAPSAPPPAPSRASTQAGQK